MALNYQYHFAEIDPNTNMCVMVYTTTSDDSGAPNIVQIPVYDPNYMLKYYIDGAWYEDAAGTIPWTSSML